MTTLIFDTHAFVKELTQAGMSEEQAEVLARSQATLIAEKLATKQDLKEMEVGLKRDIKEMETRLKHDIKKLERDMKEMEANLKRDMKEMETRLKHDNKKLERDIKELELRLKRDMQELKHDMTVRLGSMVVVAIGVVAALVKLL